METNAKMPYQNPGADPGFLKGGGGSRLAKHSLQAKKGGQTGVQVWVQC